MVSSPIITSISFLVCFILVLLQTIVQMLYFSRKINTPSILQYSSCLPILMSQNNVSIINLSYFIYWFCCIPAIRYFCSFKLILLVKRINTIYQTPFCTKQNNNKLLSNTNITLNSKHSIFFFFEGNSELILNQSPPKW